MVYQYRGQYTVVLAFVTVELSEGDVIAYSSGLTGRRSTMSIYMEIEGAYSLI